MAEDYTIKDLFDWSSELLREEIPVGDESLAKIRQDYFTGEGTREERFKNAIQRLSTRAEVKINHKRFCLMAELFAREALEKKAEGDYEEHKSHTEQAEMLLKRGTGEESIAILEEEEEKVRNWMIEKSYVRVFNPGDFNIRVMREGQCPVDLGKVRHYQKAVAALDLAQGNDRWDVNWNDGWDFRSNERRLASGEDYDESLYFFISTFITDEEDDLINRFKGDNYHQYKEEYIPIKENLIEILRKKALELKDPLGLETVGVVSKDPELLRLAIAERSNVQRQKELINILLSSELTPESAEQILEGVGLVHYVGDPKPRLQEVSDMIPLEEHLRITEAIRIKTEIQEPLLVNMPNSSDQLYRFATWYGEKCFDLVQRHAWRLYPGGISFPGRFKNFYWPLVLKKVLNEAIESLELARSVNPTQDIEVPVEWDLEPIERLQKLYCAVGKYRKAYDLWLQYKAHHDVIHKDDKLDISAYKKEVIDSLKTRLKAFDLYHNIYTSMITLQEEKRTQFDLDAKINWNSNARERRGLEKKLAGVNKTCTQLRRGITGSFKNLIKIIKEQPELSQIQYREEFSVMLAAHRLTTEESRLKAREILSSRRANDKFKKQLQKEVGIVEEIFDELRWDMTQEELDILVAEETYGGKYKEAMYFRLLQLFGGFNHNDVFSPDLDPELTTQVNDTLERYKPIRESLKTKAQLVLETRKKTAEIQKRKREEKRKEEKEERPPTVADYFRYKDEEKPVPKWKQKAYEKLDELSWGKHDYEELEDQLKSIRLRANRMSISHSMALIDLVCGPTQKQISDEESLTEKKEEKWKSVRVNLLPPEFRERRWWGRK